MAVGGQDNTASRRSMRKLDAIDRAGVELVRLDAESVRNRNTYERLELMEEKIVQLMHDVLNYDHFAIFLIEQSRQKLELVNQRPGPLARRHAPRRRLERRLVAAAPRRDPRHPEQRGAGAGHDRRSLPDLREVQPERHTPS